MATLIPALGACTSRVTAGERRLAQQSVESRWSVRELHHQIERKAFHSTDPTLVFKDPYFLDFLSLRRLVGIELKLDRFPSDFLFQLTADEKTEVVANCDHLQNLRFSTALPFAFTEHRAIQAANVLASSQAVEMGMKTESLEMSHDNFIRNTRLQLRQLLDAVRELTAPPEPPKRPIGFLTHEDKKTPKASTLRINISSKAWPQSMAEIIRSFLLH